MLTSSPSASTSSTPAPRLLYRGGLSLPDSHITLDGLTFYAPHHSPSKLRNDLLGNPLALALETMRGRPTLRLMGTLKLNDIWLDASGGDVFMCVVILVPKRVWLSDSVRDIHEMAVISRIYFENMLCLEPMDIPSGRTTYGARVALGDTGS